MEINIKTHIGVITVVSNENINFKNNCNRSFKFGIHFVTQQSDSLLEFYDVIKSL